MKEFIVLAVVLVLAWLGLAPRPAAAADPPALGSGGLPASLDLKAQLEKGLKCRRPEDFAYLAAIVKQVESGTLPRPLVDSTFAWARRQPSDRRVQYFQAALRNRAARLGIRL